MDDLEEPALAAAKSSVTAELAAPDPDSEPEDDSHQDYRFLTTLTKTPAGTQKDHLLPRRGEKDFEPHGTQAQSSTLLASQEAMREALSVQRQHGPIDAKSSSHLSGVFDPETGLTYVAREVGQILQKMGRPVRGGKGGTMLEPEEALFLLERGTLEMLYPANGSAKDAALEDEQLVSLEGVRMSLQTAYACCIGTRELTLERYIVYAGLKRAGYSVFRAKGGWGDAPEPRLGSSSPQAITQAPTLHSWFLSLVQNLLPAPKHSLPLLGKSFFRDYSTIYTHLSIIPTHSLSTSSSTPSPIQRDYPPLSVTYHAYKPSTPVKKSLLPPPDFHISVLSARDSSFPTATQTQNLITSIPSQPSAPSSATDQRPNLYATLKSGAGHVILAVVDSGLVSYVRIAEGVFAQERVWERNPLIRPVKGIGGGNRGGKGGRGRGGGRGGKRGG